MRREERVGGGGGVDDFFGSIIGGVLFDGSGSLREALRERCRSIDGKQPVIQGNQ